MPESNARPSKKPRRRRRVSVERAGPSHRELLRDFFVREWGADPTEGVESIDTDTPQWLCIRDGVAIGYLGTIPARFRVNGADLDAHWLKGFWVAESFRSGPVGPLLVEKAMADLDVVGSQVVATAARRVLESAGMVHRCTLFNRVLLLRAGRVAARIDIDEIAVARIPGVLVRVVGALQSAGVLWMLGAIGGTALRIPALLKRSRRGHVIRFGWDVPHERIDHLWATLRDQVSATQGRSAEELVQRYPSDTYELATVWRDEDLVGWSILRRPGGQDPRLGSVLVASVADMFYALSDRRAARETVRAAELTARRLGADAVLCSGSHPALEHEVAGMGYLRFPPNVQILVRDGPSHRFPAACADVWVMRGDARSDEGF